MNLLEPYSLSKEPQFGNLKEKNKTNNCSPPQKNKPKTSAFTLKVYNPCHCKGEGKCENSWHARPRDGISAKIINHGFVHFQRWQWLAWAGSAGGVGGASEDLSHAGWAAGGSQEIICRACPQALSSACPLYIEAIYVIPQKNPNKEWFGMVILLKKCVLKTASCLWGIEIWRGKCLL